MAIAWQYMPTARLRPRRSPSGFCCSEQEVEPLAHGLGVLAVGVGVARPQVGQQGQAGQGGVGLPVDALAEAGLAGRAVDR